MRRAMGFLDKLAKAEDPVCKMKVPKVNPPGGSAKHGAETYYFCAPSCRTQFLADPHKYLPHGHHH